MERMPTDLKLIPKVPFPESIRIVLPPMQESMMATWEKRKDDWDFTSGYMPKPELDRISDIYFEIFGYIADINAIVDHLNLIIGDIHFLAAQPEACCRMLGGNVSTRYNLLARTFFYEVFRTKEIHSRFLKYLRRKSVLRKQDVEEYRAQFLTRFEALVNVRNKMVHDSFVFPGMVHRNLFMAETATKYNMELKCRETGKVLTIKDAISEVSDEFMQIGFSAGTSLVEYFKMFSHACCQTMDWIREGKIKWSGKA